MLRPRRITDREKTRLLELIEKGRGYNRGIDPARIEAEVREVVEAVKEELKGDRL